MNFMKNYIIKKLNFKLFGVKNINIVNKNEDINEKVQRILIILTFLFKK